MKVYVSSDERYPDYDIVEETDTAFNTAIEVDSNTVTRWKRAIWTYNKVQQEIDDFVDAKEHGRHITK